jgi:hypothetical protein
MFSRERDYVHQGERHIQPEEGLCSRGRGIMFSRKRDYITSEKDYIQQGGGLCLPGRIIMFSRDKDNVVQRKRLFLPQSSPKWDNVLLGEG